MIQKNISLLDLNTMHINVKTDFFVNIEDEKQLIELFESKLFKDLYTKNKVFVLGGGSNVLFTKNFEGLIIKNSIKGKKTISVDGSKTIIEVSAGESREEFVKRTLTNNLFGLENLTHIPGTVGASPVQNIGAYGKEVRNYIIEVSGYNLSTYQKQIFKNEECLFGYRNSIFKQSLKGQFIITSVMFELDNNQDIYRTDISYIRQQLEQDNIKPDQINPKFIEQYISQIRSQKLPDPKAIPNTGSFFKNIVISKNDLPKLINNYINSSFYNEQVELKHFDIGGGEIKLVTAQLIDLLGFKKIEHNGVTVYPTQSLVIINKSLKATGEDVLIYSKMIKNKVKEIFGLDIEPEVNFI